jgi:hypothetical protein
MEKLTSYEFKKPSTSKYAPVVAALVDEGVFAVRLKRGEDFGRDVTLDSVQGAVSQQVRNAGRRARTFRESDDVLVVALYPEGEGPRAPRRRQARRERATA